MTDYEKIRAAVKTGTGSTLPDEKEKHAWPIVDALRVIRSDEHQNAKRKYRAELLLEQSARSASSEPYRKAIREAIGSYHKLEMSALIKRLDALLSLSGEKIKTNEYSRSNIELAE